MNTRLQMKLFSLAGRIKVLCLFSVGSCNFIKKETLAQVFSCEFCEISKNIFFTELLPTMLQLLFRLFECLNLLSHLLCLTSKQIHSVYFFSTSKQSLDKHGILMHASSTKKWRSYKGGFHNLF